ncbi:MAG: radical SAM family heme chaperone HemW [Bacillota bacterium]
MLSNKQLDFLDEIKDDLGLYIHIPFCVEKCSYCDFYSLKYKKSLFAKYLNSLKKEIKLYSSNINAKIKTIYFGGGTPSLLRPEDVKEILEIIKKDFSILKNVEITLEANPNSLNKEKLKGYKQAGINRMSVGVQSFNDKELDRLGRLHNSKKAKKTIKEVSGIFSNYNFDLISAIPEQSFENWKNNIKLALKYDPPHLSLYNLQVEEGTLIHKQINNKVLKPVSQEIDAKMYQYAIKKLSEANIKQYEISNFSKEGYLSKHNLIYWKYEPYLGLGPSAHSFSSKTRFSNYTSLKKYIAILKENKLPLKNYNNLSLEERMSEKIFLGLRLMEGINFEDFYQTFNKHIDNVYEEEIEKLISKGLLIKNNKNIKLSEKGKFLGNQVFLEFI